jgi:FAD/FMN-containing dehydrogenase
MEENMANRTMKTGRGDNVLINEVALNQLKTSIRGQMLLPDDDGYDQARRIHNVMINKHPGVIVRCASASDVIAAVNFARNNNLLLAVRGGGHSVPGYSTCEGGIMIDLSLMKGARIDLASQTVRAEAGLTWGELNQDLQTFGLGATGGYVSITGISGLTLGGGFGWLVRKHGLALDNLISADVVTADGQLRIASHNENADLFWGLRGGGGNFGIVTSFEFQVHPVGTVLAGPILHLAENAKAVYQMFREYVPRVPEELTWGMILFTVPPLPAFPAALHGAHVVALTLCYAGPIEKGEKLLRPIREFGPPLADMVQPMPYNIAQTTADFLWPKGYHNYWKSNFLNDLTDDAIDTILDYFEKVPSPNTVVLVDHNGGGAIDRVKDEDTAYGHREWTYNFLITSAWQDAEESERNIQWTKDFWRAMQPFLANRVYVNYTSDTGEELLRQAYTPEIRERLAKLKSKYDPTNLLRMNGNIQPADS